MSKGDETRKLIVDRAFVLSSAVGLDGLSLGDLAEDLSLSKSGLFAHFRSKEALQIAVVHYATERFVAGIVLPAITQPRGEARIVALFENYLRWIRGPERQGRCFFMALSQEFDDRPGAIRDLLAQSQRDWLHTLSRAAQIAIDARQFRADLDTAQFAFEFLGIGMTFQHSYKLLADPQAEGRMRAAFASLLSRSRA